MPDQAKQQHEHQRIEVRTDCPDCGQELARQTFNRADLEQQQCRCDLQESDPAARELSRHGAGQQSGCLLAAG